jgi:hypothetical protein
MEASDFASLSYTADDHASLEAPADSSMVSPIDFPEPWRQCDNRWRNDKMAKRTICQSGCLITSVAMALKAHGLQFHLKGHSKLIDPTPGTFNQWLRENKGYTSSSAFIHNSISKMCAAPFKCTARLADGGMRRTNDLTVDAVKKLLKQYKTVTANVHKGRHWVLLASWSEKYPTRFYVRDSAGSTGSDYYDMKDISGWRIYDIVGPNTPSASDAAAAVAPTSIVSRLQAAAARAISGADEDAD